MTRKEQKEAIDNQAHRVITLARLSLQEQGKVATVPEEAYIDGYCEGFIEAMKIKR